jgi:hypothetical protein
MKQLMFTSCRTSRSQNGQSGFQVRATSADLASDLRNEVAALANYHLPRGVPDDVPPAQAARRLALVDLRPDVRVLSNTVYVGRDPETNRWGNYFFHAVIGKPDDLKPLDCVRMWGSRFWKTEDDDGPVELPDVFKPELIAGPPWGNGSLKQVVSQNRAAIQFILNGLLTATENRRKLFLAVPADVGAPCIYAALEALPPGARARLTFSTYEREPMTARSRIVVSSWNERENVDLDSQCYSGVGYAYNRYSGRRSTDLPPVPDFVEFALDAMALDGTAKLREFHEKSDRYGITDGPGVAFYFDLVHGKRSLTVADLGREAAWRMADDLLEERALTVGPLLTKGALEDPAFRKDALPRFLEKLPGHTQVARQLADDFWKRGLTAAGDGDLATVKLAWDDLLARVEPGFLIGERLLAEVSAPEKLAPQVRLNLLPRVALASANRTDGPIKRWLKARPEELTEVLGKLTDARHKRTVVVQTVLATTIEKIPQAALQAVAKDPEFALKAIGEVALTNPAKAVDLFSYSRLENQRTDWATALVLYAPPLGAAGGWPPDMLDLCLANALETDPKKRDLRQWIANHGAYVRNALEQPGKSAGVLARQVLDSHTARWLEQPELKDYLSWFSKSTASQELDAVHQSQLANQFGIDEFCRNPSLADGYLRSFAVLLDAELSKREPQTFLGKIAGSLLPFGKGGVDALHQSQKERVLEATVRELLSTPESLCQQSLETVLCHLGPVYSGERRWVELFNKLLQGCESSPNFWQNSTLFTAFVLVGTGYVKDPGFTRLDDDQAHFLMYRLCDDLAGQIRRNRLSLAVTRFESLVNNWKKKADGWQDWGRYWQRVLRDAPQVPPRRRSHAPQGGNRRRDGLLMFLAFVGVVTIGTLIHEYSWIRSLFQRKRKRNPSPP